MAYPDIKSSKIYIVTDNGSLMLDGVIDLDIMNLEHQVQLVEPITYEYSIKVKCLYPTKLLDDVKVKLEREVNGGHYYG